MQVCLPLKFVGAFFSTLLRTSSVSVQVSVPRFQNLYSDLRNQTQIYPCGSDKLRRTTYEIRMDTEPFFVQPFSCNIHLVFLYATSSSFLFAFSFLPLLSKKTLTSVTTIPLHCYREMGFLFIVFEIRKLKFAQCIN